MNYNYSPLITVMMKAARNASRKLVRDFGEVENLQVSRKGPKDFVTAADLKAEEGIIYELKKARPTYSILSEESGYTEGSEPEYCWIIDPLDGTTNFMHGVSVFCTTIALQKTLPNGKKEIIAALTESPITKELFWAEKGCGAWYESADRAGVFKLKVGGRKNIADALLGVSSFSKEIDYTSNLIEKVCATRCIGSTALSLAYVAAGRFDGFVKRIVNPWDMAAGLLLVKEAGGTVTDWHGRDDMLKDKSIIVANEDLHSVILKACKG